MTGEVILSNLKDLEKLEQTTLNPDIPEIHEAHLLDGTFSDLK